jgi:beta-glucanase (GH16 family)
MKTIVPIITLTLLLASCTPEASVSIDPRSIVDESCNYLDNIDEWQPVWCDEFDIDGLPNPERWGYDVGGHGWGNQELQYYTRENLTNASVEDGVLSIRAVEESVGQNNYTSARLVSRFRGDWLYGRIQVRAKMPGGRGVWPAIWMLPTNWVYGEWPASGEIDIMEYVGYDPEIVHGTIHTGAFNHMLNTQIGFSKRVPTVETEFHVYEMIWEPGSIELFIDGTRYARFGFNPTSTVDITNSDAWPFDDPFHLIMNIAVGGTWGGARGVDPSIFPQAMEVDYVRVYQRDYSQLSQDLSNAISNPEVQKTTHNSVRFMWDKESDVLVSNYHVYADGNLVGSTTVNAFLVEDLPAETTVSLEVEAEDFSGNRSPRVSISATTQPVRSINQRVQAQAYDAMTGIRTEITEDSSGDVNVGWIDQGDSLEYILRVEEAGTYRITYRVASLDGGGELELLTRSRFPLTVTSIPKTGAWQSWTDVTSDSFTLEEGIYTFRLRAAQGGFNLNYFDFKLDGE